MLASRRNSSKVGPRAEKNGGIRLAVTPIPTREVLGTGVPECDAYAANVEVCSERMLAGDERALASVRDSLDAARRSWRAAGDAKGGAARPALADDCAASLRSYVASTPACR